MPRERILFRHLYMEKCCGTLLCWVNPRLPNYCPECGKRCMSYIRECVRTSDDDATIHYGRDTPAIDVPT